MKFWVAISILFLLGCDQFPEDIEENQVKLLTPPNDYLGSTGVIDFWWEEVEGASNYEFQIVAPSFDSPERFISDTIINVIDSIGQKGNRISVELSADVYQWRVKAVNIGYETDYSLHNLRVQ